ncbi:hypothetical protein P148_SR1C00001G0962 [candidate division SR1 bacterium RAAC1_SR1_1]|nr:hypothetical protein P148_SR1C00001G0962 [candidate division SR1 bacterium RAAC1_SR1_1]
MNIVKYSGFRLLVGSLILGGVFGWGGFVAMQDQVIEFYEQEPNYFSIYNTKEDLSLQKYLGNGQLLVDSTYVPIDLVAIDSDFTANKASRFLLRKEVAEKFADLAWHFWKDNKGDKLFITSTYRSAKFQESLLKKGCSRLKCAEVGSSEHQLGLAIDLGIMTKKGKYIALTKGSVYYKWLITKGADRGFHNSYQKGVDIDGQMEESRHRRYLGTDLAQILRDNNQSFAEWYAVQQTVLDDYLL